MTFVMRRLQLAVVLTLLACGLGVGRTDLHAAAAGPDHLVAQFHALQAAPANYLGSRFAEVLNR